MFFWGLGPRGQGAALRMSKCSVGQLCRSSGILRHAEKKVCEDIAWKVFWSQRPRRPLRDSGIFLGLPIGSIAVPFGGYLIGS